MPFDAAATEAAWAALARAAADDAGGGGVPAAAFAEGVAHIAALLRELGVALAADEVEQKIVALRAHVAAYPTALAPPPPTSTAARGGGDGGDGGGDAAAPAAAAAAAASEAQLAPTLQALLLRELHGSVGAPPASIASVLAPSRFLSPKSRERLTVRVIVTRLLVRPASSRQGSLRAPSRLPPPRVDSQWLIEMTTALVHELVDLGEPSLPKAVRAAYGATLARHHGLALRLAVKALTLLLPSRSKFLSRLAAPATAGGALNSAAARAAAPSVEGRLAAFAASACIVRDRLSVFVCEHALDVED